MAACWGSSPRIVLRERGTKALARLYPMLNLSRDRNAEFFSSLLERPSTSESVTQDREAWVYDYSAEENRGTFYVLYTEKCETIQQHSVAVLFRDDRVYEFLFLE